MFYPQLWNTTNETKSDFKTQLVSTLYQHILLFIITVMMSQLLEILTVSKFCPNRKRWNITLTENSPSATVTYLFRTWFYSTVWESLTVSTLFWCKDHCVAKAKTHLKATFKIQSVKYRDNIPAGYEERHNLWTRYRSSASGSFQQPHWEKKK